ncbi:peptidoglycan D,D-transpeptidase FtsI family protein [Megamonas hypermegale]|uniref:peptidoglycan D,D-transpeptidase FtsI family protein n=1 Tax=Megamonas hypermegale TaxID=158847 RepID=UPI0019569060|nr:penicillin-binding transpeptidase domain-containing protein [Megamonas hypermegale]MBM6761354.1 hypothetical protein [Megamonas hypermegale]
MHRQNDINKHIYVIVKVFAILFAVIFINLAYIQIYEAEDLINNPHNSHVMEKASEIQRGKILDSTGVILADTQKEKNSFKRVYPYGEVFAPPLGYVSDKLGYSGIEASQNAPLAGNNMKLHALGPLSQLFEPEVGNDVHLTLRADYQQAAYDALGERKGAVIILNRKTGEILAMVSRPSFNPNDIDANWDSLRTDENSPLLNRATQGLYPPGSTIKPLIGDGALTAGVATTDTIVNCTGSLYINSSYSLADSSGEVHGPVNLATAIMHSCNSYFGTMGINLGEKGLAETFSRFGYDKELDTDFINTSPELPDFKNLSNGELAQVGIGQSTLLVTPLRMAMLAGSIGNQGILMKPYLVKEITAPDNTVIETHEPQQWLTVSSPEITNIIYEDMKQVIASGTGTKAAVNGIEMIGKTGTAENSAGADHAWFIGCANMPNEDIAFAIIVENSGFGGGEAAPIIKTVLTNILAKEGK